MKDRRRRALKHFLLAEGYQQKIAYSLTPVVSDLDLFTQLNIFPDEQDPSIKEITGCKQYYDKDNLINHRIYEF